MHYPRYSIIIPVYKAQEYLPRLIACLQAQTDPDFEVIFVNDCSPDDSAAIITQYAVQDKRLRLVHQPRNMRQAAARNRGLDEARGEFIAFVDADDAVAPTYLERMYGAIVKHNADVALCNPLIEYSTHQAIADSFRHAPEVEELVFSRSDTVRLVANHWGAGEFFYRVEPWGKVIRHSFLRHHKIIFQGEFHEDVVFSLKLACLASCTVALRDALYIYCASHESDLNRNALKYLENEIWLQESAEKVFKENLSYDDYKYAFSKFHILSTFCLEHCFSIHISKDDYERLEQYKYLLKNIYINILKLYDVELYEKKVLNNFSFLKKSLFRIGLHDIYDMYAEKYKMKIARLVSNT